MRVMPVLRDVIGPAVSDVGDHQRRRPRTTADHQSSAHAAAVRSVPALCRTARLARATACADASSSCSGAHAVRRMLLPAPSEGLHGDVAGHIARLWRRPCRRTPRPRCSRPGAERRSRPDFVSRTSPRRLCPILSLHLASSLLCYAFLHGLAAQLTAGGVNIAAQAPPHGGGDAVGSPAASGRPPSAGWA